MQHPGDCSRPCSAGEMLWQEMLCSPELQQSCLCSTAQHCPGQGLLQRLPHCSAPSHPHCFSPSHPHCSPPPADAIALFHPHHFAPTQPHCSAPSHPHCFALSLLLCSTLTTSLHPIPTALPCPVPIALLHAIPTALLHPIPTALLSKQVRWGPGLPAPPPFPPAVLCIAAHSPAGCCQSSDPTPTSAPGLQPRAVFVLGRCRIQCRTRSGSEQRSGEKPLVG